MGNNIGDPKENGLLCFLANNTPTEPKPKEDLGPQSDLERLVRGVLRGNPVAVCEIQQEEFEDISGLEVGGDHGLAYLVGLIIEQSYIHVQVEEIVSLIKGELSKNPLITLSGFCYDCGAEQTHRGVTLYQMPNQFGCPCINPECNNKQVILNKRDKIT